MNAKRKPFRERHKHDWDFLFHFSGGGKVYHCLKPGCTYIKWGWMVFDRRR